MIIQRYIARLGTLIILAVFFYFGIHSVMNPDTYASLIPSFIGTVINPLMLVTLHGMVEMACTLLILFSLGGKWPWYILMLSFLGVLVSVSGITLVRDLGIFGGLVLAYVVSHPTE